MHPNERSAGEQEDRVDSHNSPCSGSQGSTIPGESPTNPPRVSTVKETLSPCGIVTQVPSPYGIGLSSCLDCGDTLY